MKTYEQHLRESAVNRSVIDTFLDPAQPTWARYDTELGYVLGNSMPHDGLEGCWTISTAERSGARTPVVYANRKSRINAYGDSFTQCHQVSDAETWQEYLAGHLGEPIRNFGMGGYGVYQSHRRMVRTEQSRDASKYVLFYIWGDDHSRSAMRCRHAVTYLWWDRRGGLAFHNPFWTHMEMDLDTQQLVEKPNLLPTKESLYRMCDGEFMLESLRTDLMAQLCLAEKVDPASLDHKRLAALAEILRVPPMDLSSAETVAKSALRIRYAYGFAATKRILDLTAEFCLTHGRELMVLLLCPTATWNLLNGEPRYDQTILDHVSVKNLRVFDMNKVHAEDFKNFKLSPSDYLKRYYIGHYSPAGNHFFAYSLKRSLVEWLDPKPITYRDDGTRADEFRGYLPG